MTDKERMEREAERVRCLIGDCVAQIEIEHGDIRMFAAAMLTAAIELHLEVEGPHGLQRAITRLAKHHAPEVGAGHA